MNIDNNIKSILNDYIELLYGDNCTEEEIIVPYSILNNDIYMKYIEEGGSRLVNRLNNNSLDVQDNDFDELDEFDENSESDESDSDLPTEIIKTNSGGNKIKKGKKPQYKEKVKCEICDRTYTKNNKWSHDRSDFHKRMEGMNTTLRFLLKSNMNKTETKPAKRGRPPKNKNGNITANFNPVANNKTQTNENDEDLNFWQLREKRLLLKSK